MKDSEYCTLATTALLVLTGLSAVPAISNADGGEDSSVYVEMFAPKRGDNVGVGGRSWFIDLAVSYKGDLQTSGFTSPQLTGPGVHNDVAPFPGTFSLGKDDRLPGLVVLVSTTTIGAGSCQNLANLFNLTGVTDVKPKRVEIWDTWIVGAPLFGVATQSQAYVAVAKDLNFDGIFNDAPDVVADANGDGRCDGRDLREMGVASNIEKARFYINP